MSNAVISPIALSKLAGALEHSADHDPPEERRKVMFSVAWSLYDYARRAERPASSRSSQVHSPTGEV